jgi:hypothetical protein
VKRAVVYVSVVPLPPGVKILVTVVKKSAKIYVRNVRMRFGGKSANYRFGSSVVQRQPTEMQIKSVWRIFWQ